MSEKEVINETMEGATELVEVPNNNTLCKAILVGSLLAAGITLTMIINYMNKKTNTVE